MVTIPPEVKIGLGTGSLTGDICREAVKTALRIGYRHIDTAQSYENEKEIGKALADSKISRDELFLATKIHSENLGYDDILTSVEQSCSRLGVDSIDLLYIHWPAHTYNPSETMAAFERLYNNGRIKHIGVSNFTRELLSEAQLISDAPLFANQVEMHPFLQQKEIHEFALENEILTVAHSPFAGGEVFKNQILSKVADKHDVSIAQVTLAWLLGKKNVAVIPQATGRHLYENFNSISLSLDQEDLTAIESIDREVRTVDYDFAPWNN